MASLPSSAAGTHPQAAPRAAGGPVSPPDARVRCIVSPGLVPYGHAVETMERMAAAIAAGRTPETVWFLEHPPVLTAGTRTRAEHIPADLALDVVETGRGGALTYHGPGQRIVYVMLDVRRQFAGDMRRMTSTLEAAIIAALATCGIAGRTVAGRTGVWVADRPASPAADATQRAHDDLAKIAAMGLKVRSGISLHGFAVNVTCDLEVFSRIVPCGVPGARAARVCDLSPATTLAAVDAALTAALASRLGVRLEATGDGLMAAD